MNVFNRMLKTVGNLQAYVEIRSYHIVSYRIVLMHTARGGYLTDSIPENRNVIQTHNNSSEFQ